MELCMCCQWPMSECDCLGDPRDECNHCELHCNCVWVKDEEVCDEATKETDTK